MGSGQNEQDELSDVTGTMGSGQNEQDELSDGSITKYLNRLGGKPAIPGGLSETQRRSLIAAMGGAATMSMAGCLRLFDDPAAEPDPDEEPDPDAEPPDEDPDPDPGYPLNYAELEEMRPDVRPKKLVKPLDVQIGFNDEEIVFRFQWDQPNPGGWIHDMIYYNGEEWERLSNWDPWVLDADAPEGAFDHHRGYYEDRLSFLWHDETLRGFENFGGWLTVMEGVRTLPGEASRESVENHPHFGEGGLNRSDMRKYIPQSREGEWWEHAWDEPKSQDELDRMLEGGEFLDFPLWRAHRSNPMGYGTNHYLLDYRHGNHTGQDTFGTQDWDAETGPEYMFDPEIVDGGAVDRTDVVTPDGAPNDEDMPDQGDFEQYVLIEDENMVPFDPDVAEWEGAMIPRRPLREPTESGTSWRATGVWEDGMWTVEMRRELDTGYVDDMPVEPGEVYTFAPAIHHGVSQRWHWVAYPYKLGIGTEPAWFGDDTDLGTTELVAEEFDGEDPDWNTIETNTLPLMYPGMTDWTWLTSGEHPRVNDVREAAINIWEYHDEDPESFAERMVDLEEQHASRK